VLRLFVPRAQAEGPRIRITGGELRHLRTLRLGRGERLVVFDERGDEHEVRLERVGGYAAEAIILATHHPVRESSLDLTLAPALLKGAKMDLVVEKATELGVRRIVPVVSRYAIVQDAPPDRLGRWRRIALAATKQCGRTSAPAVEPPVPFEELVRRARPGLGVIAWEGERETSLASLPGDVAAVSVLVGPEGGFADDEVAAATAHGFITFTLAPRILRAETAALAAVTLCQHRWGDLSTARRVR
jgi:16S rRNA (uracil1498-N3)-methyltransferase